MIHVIGSLAGAGGWSITNVTAFIVSRLIPFSRTRLPCFHHFVWITVADRTLGLEVVGWRAVERFARATVQCAFTVNQPVQIF